MSGNLFMQAASPASRVVKALREGARRRPRAPRHARRGDEREGRDGHLLDGRVTAVVGTHTHVQTSDARVLPGGTAYVTDLGMTGARESVIGVKREQSISVFRTQMPARYDSVGRRPVADGGSSSGPPPTAAGPSRAVSIETILRPANSATNDSGKNHTR